MRLGTRLLVPLVLVVSLVMAAYGGWGLRQRQGVQMEEARRETRAYATALGIGLEHAFRDPDLRDVQTIIDRISREPQIYGVLVYSRDGRARFVSDPLQLGAAIPPAVLGGVLRTGNAARFEREIEGQPVYSVLQPIAGPGGAVVGAFEVAQPLASLHAEAARVRTRYVLNTLTLIAALSAVILWLVRRLVANPLDRLVTGVRALGRGELAYRIEPGRGAGEVAELAREFNRMADGLQTARLELLGEAEERVALERRLRHAEKLAAVGNLAAGLAHEIAAPLHVIRGRAELLIARDSAPDVRDRNLRVIVEQIARITLVVHNLLDFARRREPRMEPTDVAAVVNQVAEFLEGEFARAGARLVREGAPSALVTGDPNLLYQVFVNLLINSLQAMESTGGERRITVRITPPDPAGRMVVVEVEDTGPGISPEVLPRLFEPFFTTKTGGQGTGLGLAVVQSIVEEHGGAVAAATGPAGGARFRLSFAAAAPEAAHA
jgi:signal transduction histidine kinase